MEGWKYKYYYLIFLIYECFRNISLSSECRFHLINFILLPPILFLEVQRSMFYVERLLSGLRHLSSVSHVRHRESRPVKSVPFHQVSKIHTNAFFAVKVSFLSKTWLFNISDYIKIATPVLFRQRLFQYCRLYLLSWFHQGVKNALFI